MIAFGNERSISTDKAGTAKPSPLYVAWYFGYCRLQALMTPTVLLIGSIKPRIMLIGNPGSRLYQIASLFHTSQGRIDQGFGIGHVMDTMTLVFDRNQQVVP